MAELGAMEGRKKGKSRDGVRKKRRKKGGGVKKKVKQGKRGGGLARLRWREVEASRIKPGQWWGQPHFSVWWG